jgi:hypothetical protein
MGLNYSFKPLYKCDYSIQTNSISGHTEINSKSADIYMVATLSYTLLNFKKREKKKHFVPEYNDKNEVTAINGRKVNNDKVLTVKNTSIQIELSDYGKEDGDKISLFINDQRILKKFKLTHKKKLIQVNLKPGLNKLIVYAHNLGTDPPNTASVVIFDGDQKHKLSLESTLGECGALVIYCGE